MEKAKHLIRTRKYSEALDLFLELYRQNPENLEILEGIARCHFGLKKYNKSLSTCNQALSINKNISWPHLIKSYILLTQKRLASSKEEAKAAIEIAPLSWEPIFLWGTILCYENKTDEGINYLEKASSIESNEWSLYNNLAIAYFKKRNYKKYYWALAEMNRIRPSLLLSFLIAIGKALGFSNRIT